MLDACQETCDLCHEPHTIAKTRHSGTRALPLCGSSVLVCMIEILYPQAVVLPHSFGRARMCWRVTILSSANWNGHEWLRL